MALRAWHAHSHGPGSLTCSAKKALAFAKAFHSEAGAAARAKSNARSSACTRLGQHPSAKRPLCLNHFCFVALGIINPRKVASEQCVQHPASSEIASENDQDPLILPTITARTAQLQRDLNVTGPQSGGRVAAIPDLASRALALVF